MQEGFSFANSIITWYKINYRELPWRQTNDPYKIWLSEVILQQTRVIQGLPYYNKFIEKYPSIQDLASAPEDEVLSLWQGLGYYSRARNLLKTAIIIQDLHQGKFPNSYVGLLELNGIGRYTAAAIASFAYNEKIAVVDGNVLRVLARYFGISDPIDIQKTKNTFFDLANSLIPANDPATHNQAIMELGALVCLPKKAKCLECPLTEVCIAYHEKKVYDLPVKTKKKVAKDRYFQYFVYIYNGTIGLRKRSASDIWQNLWDFPMIESESFKINGLSVEPLANLPIEEVSDTYKHILTHQRIFAIFCQVEIDDISVKEQMETEFGVRFVPMEELHVVAKPILIKNYLDKEILYINSRFQLNI